MMYRDSVQRRHLGGGLGGRRPPSKENENKQKRKKEKIEKKRKRKKGTTMNDVKLLHIKCCFFPIFQYSGGIKNEKIFGPREKVEITPLIQLIELMVSYFSNDCNGQIKYCFTKS